MSRLALVMGFGFGQANDAIAMHVSKRHEDRSFDHISTQHAVLKPLQKMKLPNIQLMHKYRPIYVTTLRAAGLGLIKFSELGLGGAPVDLEVLAHDKQFERAKKSTELAKIWLENAPSSPAMLKEFLKLITVSGQPPQKAMPMNRIYQVSGAWVGEMRSWRRWTKPQIWTWAPWLYQWAETRAKQEFDEIPGDFYAELIELKRKLV